MALHERSETFLVTTEPSRVPSVYREAFWHFRNLLKDWHMMYETNGVSRNFQEIRFDITKPFEVCGTKKGSEQKPRNLLRPTKLKIVPWNSREPSWLGKELIFFTV